MQYSPKLKKAASEIKDILKKYDIGASIILHTPGNSEYLNEITPSYSCIKFEGQGIRFKTKGRSEEDVSATVNMISLFADTCKSVSDMNSFLLTQLKEYLEIEESDTTHTSDGEINN